MLSVKNRLEFLQGINIGCFEELLRFFCSILFPFSSFYSICTIVLFKSILVQYCPSLYFTLVHFKKIFSRFFWPIFTKKWPHARKFKRKISDRKSFYTQWLTYNCRVQMEEAYESWNVTLMQEAENVKKKALSCKNDAWGPNYNFIACS